MQEEMIQKWQTERHDFKSVARRSTGTMEMAIWIFIMKGIFNSDQVHMKNIETVNTIHAR